MTNKERFIELLRKINREGIDELISYLSINTDFFEAPASTRFHGSYQGGLVEHSLNVFDRLLYNVSTSDLNINIENESIMIISLLHDICKSNFYKETTRNVKNETSGKWEQVPYYTVEDQYPLGHGEKSVMIISKFIKLTDEEIMCIRWHMGFSEPKENYSYLSKAIEKYPTILFLMNADMEATYFIENTNNSVL